MTSWTKSRTLKFIEIYRRHECLWSVNNKDYANKFKKDKAYQELTAFVKSFIPDANKDTVTSKISNIRSSFRKEIKKIKNSQESGPGPGDEEPYTPILFYFEALSFIADSMIPRKGREPIDAQGPDNGSCSLGYFKEENDVSQAESGEPLHDPDMLNDDQPATFAMLTSPSFDSDESQGPSTSTTPTESRAVPPKRMGVEGKRKRSALEDNLLLLACERLSTPAPGAASNDPCELFGQTVGHDLRTLNRDQYIHAKKLISDVLYEAQLDRLSVDTKILNVPDTTTEPSS